MKTKHFLLTLMLGALCLSFLPVSCGNSSKKGEEITFVTTMDCGGCQKTIETSLTGAPGVLDFKADLATKEVWVKFDPQKTNIAALIEVIGYSAVKKGA